MGDIDVLDAGLVFAALFSCNDPIVLILGYLFSLMFDSFRYRFNIFFHVVQKFKGRCHIVATAWLLLTSLRLLLTLVPWISPRLLN